MFAESFEKVAKVPMHLLDKGFKAMRGKANKGTFQKVVGKGQNKKKIQVGQDQLAKGQAHRADVRAQGADPLTTPIQKRLQNYKNSFETKRNAFGRKKRVATPGAGSLYKSSPQPRPQFSNQRTTQKMQSANTKMQGRPAAVQQAGGPNAPTPANQSFTEKAQSFGDKVKGQWQGLKPWQRTAAKGTAAVGGGVMLGSAMSGGGQQPQQAPQMYY